MCVHCAGLSVIKRLENASVWSAVNVLRLSAQSFYRLNTLNLRLTLQAWFLCFLKWAGYGSGLSIWPRVNVM
ncbi:MAG: hypothetical protein ACI9FZ_000828 [Bacteroidia bacterium]|jgi:hypothetical protein